MSLPMMGQVVIYRQPVSETPANGHRDHPAIVTKSWDGACINVKVLFDHWQTQDRASVLHVTAEGHDADAAGGWYWPREQLAIGEK